MSLFSSHYLKVNVYEAPPPCLTAAAGLLVPETSASHLQMHCCALQSHFPLMWPQTDIFLVHNNGSNLHQGQFLNLHDASGVFRRATSPFMKDFLQMSARFLPETELLLCPSWLPAVAWVHPWTIPPERLRPSHCRRFSYRTHQQSISAHNVRCISIGSLILLCQRCCMHVFWPKRATVIFKTWRSR